MTIQDHSRYLKWIVALILIGAILAISYTRFEASSHFGGKTWLLCYIPFDRRYGDPILLRLDKNEDGSSTITILPWILGEWGGGQIRW